MTSPTEDTYGDIRMNDRYKRLKRNLKIKLIRGAEKRNTNNGINNNPLWSNDSMTNGNNSGVSSFNISLCSTNASEVVPSSKNMRNVLLQENQKNIQINNNDGSNDNKDNIAAPSVKKLLLVSDAVPPALMPPPKSMGILAHSSKHDSFFSVPKCKNKMQFGTVKIGDNCNISSCSIYSSIKSPSASNVQDTSQILYEREQICDNIKNDSIPTKKPERIFSKWRVMLNIKGQLIIKGTLECGKIARSKPVICRLSRKNVLSMFNHIYNLNGNIYDEKNELPDYIRDKFINGFPVDWQNVYQVWRNFVATGSKKNFRWPTSMADSDDDIKSEITEVTVTYKIKKKPHFQSDSLKNSNHIFTQLGTNQTLTNTEGFDYSQSHRSSTNTICNESTKSRSPFYNNKCSNITTNTRSLNKTRCEELDSSFTAVRAHKLNISVTSLKDVLPADKLSIILEKLNNEKCSIEYIDKIFQMYDCYRYIMSYQSEADNKTDNSKLNITTSNEKFAGNNCTLQKNFNKNFRKSGDSRAVRSRSIMIHNDENKNPYNDYKSASKRIKNMKVCEKLTESDYDSSDSRENTSKYDRSRRFSQRTNIKKIYKKLPGSEGQSNRKRIIMSDNSDDDDDYVPKRDLLSIPAGTGLHEQKIKIGMTSGPQHCHDLMSFNTITNESKFHGIKQKTLKRNIDSKKNNINMKTHSEYKPNVPDKYLYNNSNVSITDDEFVELNKETNSDKKKQFFHEINVDCTPRVTKAMSIGLKHSHIISPHYNRREMPQSQSKICKIDEKCQVTNMHKKQEFPPNKSNNETIPNDNEENQSINACKNGHNGSRSFMNSYKLKTSEPIIITKSVSPKKRRNLTTVEIENVSINLNSKLLTKPQSHESINACLEQSKEHGKIPISNETVRSLKSISDKKKTDHLSSDLSANTDQLKSVCRSKDLRINTIKNKSMSVKEEQTNIIEDVFGSKNNPKRLTDWAPNVLQKTNTDYGLIFKGKLLNVANHIINEKFTTDIISTRVSLKIVKTESNEYYQLVGDLFDVKHSMPKELQMLCRNGCPSNIVEFCGKWKKLILNNSNSSRDSLNMSKDIQNIPMSSRGRRILPPLCYWTGERVALKDNEAIYNPGISHGSSSLLVDLTQDELQNSSKHKDTTGIDLTISMKKNSSVLIQKKSKTKNFSEVKKKNSNLNIGKILSNRQSPIIMSNNLDDMESQQDNRRMSVKRRLSRQLNLNSYDSMDDNNTRKNSKRQRSKVNYCMMNLENDGIKSREECRGSRESIETSTILRPIGNSNEKNDEYKPPSFKKDRNSVKNKNSGNPYGLITYEYKKKIDCESELSEDEFSNF